MTEIFKLVICFFIGAIFGSFLNVCICRLPRGESLLSHSTCPNCDKRIKPYYNIPVFGYLILNGKCADCNWPIPLRYLLVEFLSGAILCLLFLKFSFTPEFYFYTFFSFSLIVVTFIDLEHQLILNKMTLPGILVGFALSLLLKSISLKNLIGGIVAGGGFLLAVAFIGQIIYRKESMGGGDIKFAAMIGAFLGLHGMIFTFLIAFVVAALVGGVIQLRFRTKYIPFGPFLSLGAFIYIFTQDILAQQFVVFHF